MIGKRYRIKSGFIFFCILIMFVFLAYRLFVVQVLGRNLYGHKARDMHRIELRAEPARGEICDRHGNALAVSVPMPSVTADPAMVEDPAEAALALSGVLRMDKKDLEALLARDKRFVWLKRKITPEEKEKVQDMGASVKGVFFREELTRFYPKGSLASHSIGFVDIDNNGLEGLEIFFDGELKGEPGLRVTEKDEKGRELVSWRNKNILPIDGDKIVLTIDEVIQYIVEEELDNAVDIYNAKGASAVVMDPFTGEILAMANKPDYDLNAPGKVSSDKMRNRTVTDMFEPGSGMKVFVAAAALNEGLFGLKDMIFCENGTYRTSGRTLTDVHPYGTLSFRQVIEKSSNIGMAKVAQKIGEEKLYGYLRDFGFGQKTGVTLPGEAEGKLAPIRTWSGMSLASIAMGYEISVTALQLTRALCVVANDGQLMRPLIVKKIINSRTRSVTDYKPEIIRQVISPDTAKQLRSALTGVVGPDGTARRAAINGFSVAGKTGTAKKAAVGGYSSTYYFSSFIGFVSASLDSRPRFVMSVILDSPRPVYYGGSTAAPVFKNIAEKLITYLNVKPETESTEKTMAGR